MRNHMPHLGVPRIFGSGIVFAILCIVGLSFLAFGGCERPALTAGERQAERIANERASAENAMALEKMRLELEIESEQAQGENEVKVLELQLELETMRNEHAVALGAARRDAAIASPVSMAWGLGKVFLIVCFVVTAFLFAAYGYGLVGAARQFATRKAQESYADGNGLFPMRWTVDKQGNLLPYEPNRALAPGAHIDRENGQITSQDTTHPLLQAHITGSLLEVQKMAALGQLLIKNPQIDLADIAGLLPAPQDDDGPIMQWPHNVPLQGLLRAQGGASIDSIVWGMTLNPETGQQEVVKEGLDKLCHIGVGGSSGWGKSRFVEMLLFQLLTAKEKVDVCVVDLKREHVNFNDANLLYPVATTAPQATAIFGELSKELDRRLDLMGGALSLDEYNSKRDGDEPELKRLVLVGDETTALFRAGDKDLVDRIQNLALLGRSAGLLMVLAGQNWKVGNSGGSETRDQLSSRCQFKANSKSQSRLLVDCPDAAELQDQGRAVVIMPGRERFTMQGAFIGRDEIERVLSGHNGPRNPMPQVVDVTPTKKALKPAKLSPGEQERAKELGENDMSTTGILKDLFGRNGKSGPRALAVNQLLGRVSTGVSAS